MRIAALAGGTGAAKFLRGLSRLLPPEDLTVIGNTGDDTEIWGLHISPDLDTVCYTLAGVVDQPRGWGIAGDTFDALEQMGRFGEPTWFNLGDRDLATHLHRTRLLRAGRALTEVTAAIALELGVGPRVLPMSDHPVRTRILGPDGWLGFQEYFVRDKAQPEVRAVSYGGAEEAVPAPGVVDSIRSAAAVIVCPSNPITSIGPILAVPGIARALAETAARVVAISPIVGGAPVSGPAGRLMAARGLPVSAAGVAQGYLPWLDVLVLDERDARQASEVERLGVTAIAADSMMTSREGEVALARRVVDVLSGRGGR
jgi:LPPG:FO 2-phospho-L-lactate transferase